MMRLGISSGSLHLLCLAAHPDDIEIGCGGALLTISDRPDFRLTAMIMTGSEEPVEESRAALSRFVPGVEFYAEGFPDGRLPGHWDGVKTSLEELAKRCDPDLILAPRVDDSHQDHRLIGQLVPTVWRDALVLHYEIPKWDGDLASTTHYVALSDRQARRKVELLNDCFPSQTDRDWWDDELFFGLMRIRGVECRAPYAEGFFASKVPVDLSGR